MRQLKTPQFLMRAQIELGGGVTITVSQAALSVRGAGASHPGTRPGLSICRKIPGAHGWRLGYRDGTPGPGAEVELVFQGVEAAASAGWIRCATRHSATLTTTSSPTA